MHSGLEGNHIGPLGIGSGKRLPVGAGTDTLPNRPSVLHSMVRQRTTSNFGRNPILTDQGCSGRGRPTDRPIYQQAICDSEERRVTTACSNLRPLNHFLENHHFKMEDLKDAYLSVPIAKQHRKFLRFVWDGITYEFTYRLVCAVHRGFSRSCYVW